MPTSEIVYLGELRTEAKHLQSGNCIVTDAPLDNQGKGEAFSPTDLTATSLASCMITVMGIKANNMEWELTEVRAQITKHMANEPRRISKIEIHMQLSNLLTEKQRKSLEISALNCPVAKSLSPEIEQDVHFEYNL